MLGLAAWFLFPPVDDPPRGDFARQVLGEAIAGTAVILLATALVLATRLRVLEPAFGGLDKMYRWHRRAGQTGMVVLALHVVLIPWRGSPGGGVPAGLIGFFGLVVMVLLTLGPRIPGVRRVMGLGYRAWRATHRFIGAFFAMGLAHMYLVDSVVASSRVVLVILTVAFAVGIVAWLYSLLLAWAVRPSYRYRVDSVTRLGPAVVAVELLPRGRRRLDHRAGQFVLVRFAHRGLREPHPFTVSSAPGAERVRLTVKSLGDYTRRLSEQLPTGRRARIEGAYGMLNFRTGRHRQVWVAGGIGVTPFLSWVGDAAPDDDVRVDFLYTVRHREDVLFWDEITDAAARVPWLTVHLNVSSEDGSVTSQRVAELAGGDLAATSFYLCGPVPMIAAVSKGLRRAGVRAADVHYEEFSFR